MRKGFPPSWQRLSHHIPTPWVTRPGPGLVQPPVTKFRARHICSVSSESPPPQRLPCSWALATDLIPGLQRSLPLGLRSRRAAVLTQSDPPGTAVLGLSGPNTCRARSGPAEATAALTSRPTACLPGVPACVWDALRPTPALTWQRPRAFFMPTSPAQAPYACIPARLHTPERGFGKSNNQHFRARPQP